MTSVKYPEKKTKQVAAAVNFDLWHITLMIKQTFKYLSFLSLSSVSTLFFTFCQL